MEEIRKKYKAILIIVAVVIGLITLVYLIQRQQIIKSRAEQEINATLSVTDENGSELEYIGNDTFKTTSRRIIIKNKDLPF